MKRMLLAGTAVILGGQALAASPGVGARWNGCYIGAHAGAGWGSAGITEPIEPLFQYFAPAGTAIDVDTGAGFIGGVQVGCDRQFVNNWVVGAAGDWSWADIEGQAADPFFAGKSGGPILLNAKTEWMATLTGRVGYAWDRWLVYGKGGAAWGRHKFSIENLTFWGNPTIEFCATGGPVLPCNPSGSVTRVGWMAGFGVEWAVAGNWTAALEYDHYDFGSHSVTLTDPNGVSGAPASGPVDVKNRIDAVTFSVNYRFTSLAAP